MNPILILLVAVGAYFFGRESTPAKSANASPAPKPTPAPTTVTLPGGATVALPTDFSVPSTPTPSTTPATTSSMPTIPSMTLPSNLPNVTSSSDATPSTDLSLPTGAPGGISGTDALPSLPQALTIIDQIPDDTLKNLVSEAYQHPKSADSLDALAASLVDVSPQAAGLISARARQLRAQGM